MKRAILVIGGVVAAAALAAGLVLFQPWLLFSDVRVDEALPSVQSTRPAATPESASSAAPSPGSEPEPEPEPVPVVLLSGSFVGQEHATTGTASIVENPDGTRVLALENLDTSNGPDVHVWLSAADAVEGVDGWFLAGDEAYVDLGTIKGNQGNQVYDIPAEVELSAYRSVSLWCVQFGVGFGAAQLG